MAQPLRQRGPLIVGVLLVALIASSWRMFSLEGQQHRITQAYEQARQELSQLQDELREVRDDLSEARDRTVTSEAEVRTFRAEIRTFRSELTRLQKQLDETMTELTSIQRQYQGMRQRNVALTDQLRRATTEKQQFEAKWSSIEELRMAIRTVKRNMRERRVAVRRAHIAAQKKKDERLSAVGNRGYLVRNGESTLGKATKLQVRVLELQGP